MSADVAVLTAANASTTIIPARFVACSRRTFGVAPYLLATSRWTRSARDLLPAMSKLVPRLPSVRGASVSSRQNRQIFHTRVMKTQTASILLFIFVIACGFSTQTRAVVPPPDGGYPNFTTAEGTNALKNLTTGAANTAVGWYSLFSDTDGSFNTATGAGSLLFNTGSSNTAIGAASLLFNIDGSDNTALGAAALLNNTGSGNTAVGSNALVNNNSGSLNTAIGQLALNNNTMGTENTAIGEGALLHNDTGLANTATGTDALISNIDGLQNTANGFQALFNNTSGDQNTAIGYNTLFNNTSGSNNLALGTLAGDSVTTADNVICIGAAGEDVSNSCYVGNIFGSTASGGIAVLVNSSGKLGTSPSSQRFKEQIRPMDKSSEALYALEPVTFRYKKDIDPAGTSQFGLVAEDVEKVNPDLVVRDNEGKPYSVRYDQVNAMLLNEFLKEHKQIQAQQSKIEKEEQKMQLQERTIGELRSTLVQQQKQIQRLTAGLQKVSAHLEMSRNAPNVVRNDR
jgi:hypothetical protein